MEIGKLTKKTIIATNNSSSEQKNIKKDITVINYNKVDSYSDMDIDNQIDFSISNITNSIKDSSDKPKTNFEELLDFQKTHTKEETYKYFKETLSDLAQKDKEGFKDLINSILWNGNAHYDKSKNTAPIADNQAEVLEKMLTTSGELDNAICTTIHGFAMETLHEIGIDATLIAGEEGGGHATLIYQLEDGKYIFNDYGKSIEIEADNVIQATKIAQRETNFNNLGEYVQILGEGSDFYEEYAFKEEAAYGNEIDSKNANKTTAFKNDKITGKSGFSISADRNSSISQTIIDGKAEYINEDVQLKVSAGLQYRITKGQTDNFNGATSSGFKVEAAKNFDLDKRGQITADATIIGNTVNGVGVGNNDFGAIKEQAGVSYSKDIYKNLDTKVTNAVRFQEDVTFGRSNSLSTTSDIRLQLEDGIKLTKENDFLTMETLFNAGIMANYAISDYANQFYQLNLGGKGNIEGSIKYSLNENNSIEAKVQGFLSGDKVHANYGVGGELTFRHESHNPYALYSDSAFEAAVGYNIERTDINVGGFNENVHNEQNLNIGLMYDLGGKMNLYGNYNFELVQKRHDISFGMKYNYD